MILMGAKSVHKIQEKLDFNANYNVKKVITMILFKHPVKVNKIK